MALVPPATSTAFVAAGVGGLSNPGTRTPAGTRKEYNSAGFWSTPMNMKSGPPVAVAPGAGQPAPVVALGIVASKVNCAEVAEATVCSPPLMAATSAAVQPLPALAVTPEIVTMSLTASVLAAVTVNTVGVAVTPVTVNSWVLKNSVSGAMTEAPVPS